MMDLKSGTGKLLIQHSEEPPQTPMKNLIHHSSISLEVPRQNNSSLEQIEDNSVENLPLGDMEEQPQGQEQSQQ
jgi:hypothetical protein